MQSNSEFDNPEICTEVPSRLLHRGDYQGTDLIGQPLQLLRTELVQIARMANLIQQFIRHPNTSFCEVNNIIPYRIKKRE